MEEFSLDTFIFLVYIKDITLSELDPYWSSWETQRQFSAWDSVYKAIPYRMSAMHN
jgi:hypothetical protein